MILPAFEPVEQGETFYTIFMRLIPLSTFPKNLSPQKIAEREFKLNDQKISIVIETSRTNTVQVILPINRYFFHPNQPVIPENKKRDWYCQVLFVRSLVVV